MKHTEPTPHKKKMKLRREDQNNRKVTSRKFKHGKYLPAIEDKKHNDILQAYRKSLSV